MRKKEQRRPGRSMWQRMLSILLILVLVMGLVPVTRLVKIMGFEGEKYQSLASEQQLYDTTLSAPRGDIYDTNKKILATSATCWTVFLTPNNFKDIKKSGKAEKIKKLIAENLSEILSLNYEEVLEKTQKTKSYYVTVKKKVEKPEADKIRAFILEHEDYDLGKYIGLDESSMRYYPNDSLASVLLGFVGDDNQGLSGIESYYDSDLTGVPGRVVAAKSAQGTDMPFSYEKVISSKSGNSLVLTVDSYIQYVIEKYLDAAVIENAVAERGVAICMNVKTGAVLGMAIKGDFNPNEPFVLCDSDKEKVNMLEGEEKASLNSQLLNRQWRNKAVSDSYEPGSVFKIITASAALEENVASKNSTYNCPGYIVIAGQHYHCHKHSGHGTQNLVTAMSNSCNPVFITLGTLLGSKLFSKYFEAFGLTEKTGIDLPGEVSSLYYEEKDMGPVELASAAFGQTFSITPIQLITAISAAVNGGYLLKPYVVSQVLDSKGEVVKTTSTTVKRQVVSETTSKIICEMLETVVDGGGGKNAYVSGYRTGGKTGTSEKLSKMRITGASGLYVGSYCGVAPIDDPEIALLVLLDEPTAGQYYGGTISAPAGGQMLSEILPYLGYEPQYSEKELAKLSKSVPEVVGSTVAAAKQTFASSGLNCKVVGNGETVVKQVPAAGQKINSSGTAVLYTENDAASTIVVPNFIGSTLASAASTAASAGINIEYSGNTAAESGVTAYKQSIQSGTQVESGTVVTVYFRDNTAVDFAGG